MSLHRQPTSLLGDSSTSSAGGGGGTSNRFMGSMMERLMSSLLADRGPSSRASTLGTAAPADAPTETTTTLPRQQQQKQKEGPRTRNEWVGFGIELFLRVAISSLSAFVLLQLMKKMYSSNNLLGEDNGAPASAVYKRLQAILLKRRLQELEELGDDDDDDDDNNHNTNPASKARKLSQFQLSTTKIVVPILSHYERQMAEEILDPDDIESSFADIGGLDDTKRQIYELAVLPLIRPDLFAASGKLIQPPCKGILLYGKPGTGKTMMAKALAKEAKAIFLPLQLSKILNKWVGESNKLIAATFSLAYKLQPAIIFIDELDTFLRANNSETAYLDSIKAEFLTLWDGVSTSGSSRVLVLGATNKPQTIDSAILRRMPRAFKVPLPDERGRLAILQVLLRDERFDDSVQQFLPELARLTAGYSGSDLKEVCKAAAMVAIQEQTAEHCRRRVMGELPTKRRMKNRLVGKNEIFLEQPTLRALSKDDLISGLKEVKQTGAVAKSYGREQAAEQREDENVRGNAIELDMHDMRNLMIMLKALAGPSSSSSSSNEAGKPPSSSSADDVPQLS